MQNKFGQNRIGKNNIHNRVCELFEFIDLFSDGIEKMLKRQSEELFDKYFKSIIVTLLFNNVYMKWIDFVLHEKI